MPADPAHLADRADLADPADLADRAEAADRAEPAAAGEQSHPQPPALPAAVLWDLDGTLVDTEPYWMAAEFAVIEEHGGTWSTAQAYQLVGADLLDSARLILEQAPMPLTPRQVVDRLIDGVCRRIRERVPWRPGARELLSELADLSVPCALVTSSWRPVVDALLESIPHGAFQVVVTGDQVSHGKPHPEPYLTAAAALGVPVNDCVALEDSLTGMTAAVASGAKTIVIPNVVPLTPHKDAFLVPSLHGVNAADLVTLTRSRTGASAPHG